MRFVRFLTAREGYLLKKQDFRSCKIAMASTQVERPGGVNIKEDRNVQKKVQFEQQRAAHERFKRRCTIPVPGQSSCKKLKCENNGCHHKFGRKRSHSFSCGNGKFLHPYKRRKKEEMVPPTKFLLGGNICDPLNLNSLQDEEVNRAANALTPHTSPVPTPRKRTEEIEVLIPPNINDPLNLNAGDDAELELKLVSPTKKKKSRNRRKKRISGGSLSGKEESEDTSPEKEKPEKTEESPKEREKEKEKEKEKEREKRAARKSCEKDKIVSPVIPQPGAWKRPPPHNRTNSRDSQQSDSENKGHKNKFSKKRKRNEQNQEGTPNFRKNDVNFQYGNYNRYYGYRNPSHEDDPRLKCFKKEYFKGKDVLDLGCNIGHITLTVAREFEPKKIVGLDIDRKLIDIAKKNIKHYVNSEVAGGEKFPVSMPILYGPIAAPNVMNEENSSFPHNVTFVHGNYVLDSDTLLSTEQPQFDVILCLSVTKWVHLNWGDAGLKQMFHRMYAQLKPGGKLILESQAWNSYKKKKKLTETIFKNYSSIQLHPQKFTEYLLSDVGFSKCEVIATPHHHSKGFQRPIQMFTKGEPSPARTGSCSGTPLHTDNVYHVKCTPKTECISADSPSEMLNVAKSECVGGEKLADVVPERKSHEPVVEMESCDSYGSGGFEVSQSSEVQCIDLDSNAISEADFCDCPDGDASTELRHCLAEPDSTEVMHEFCDKDDDDSKNAT